MKKKLNMIIVVATYVVFVEFNMLNFSLKTFVTTSIVTTISISIFINNSTFVVIDFLLKTQFFNDIIVYDTSSTIVKLIAMTKKFFIIWNDQNTTIDIFEKQWMSIDLKLNVNVKSIKIYSMKLKKREIIDVIFDKMHVDDKMIWSTQSTIFNFSIFVVWRDIFNDFKNKVIVNIKNLNKVTKIDTYFMSLQTNIINVVVDFNYIFIVDVINWFH